MELSSTVMLWLVAANILLIAFVIIDRLLLLRKKSHDLEDQFVKEAFTNLHRQIQQTNKQIADNTLEFQKQSQEQTLELLASIRSTIFQRYEVEFQLIDESVKKSLENVETEVNKVIENVKANVSDNNTKVSDKYTHLSDELQQAVNRIIEETEKQVKGAVAESKEQVKQQMEEELEEKINNIVNTVLHNSITLRDHEKLIEVSIDEYLKNRT